MPAPTEDVTHASPAPSDAIQRRSVRNHILFTIAVLLLLGVAWRLRAVLELIYVSALFAVVLTPLVRWVEALRIGRYRPSRVVSILLLMVTVLGLLFLLFFFGLPPVLRDLEHFTSDLPTRIPRILAELQKVPLLRKIGLSNLAARAENFIGAFAAYIVNAAPQWLGHIFDILTAIVLTIYFMLEGEAAFYYLLAMVPADARDRFSTAMLTAQNRMSKWLLGQSLLMLILGVSSTVVYGFLHVRYFFLLGTLMGIFNIIPVVGAIITVLLSAAAAALDSWTKVLGVFIFYAIYAQIENAYLTPRIMRTSVNLMGLSVLIALLVGTAIAGVVGALVSVPTAALIGVLVQEYWVKKDHDALRLQQRAEKLNK